MSLRDRCKAFCEKWQGRTQPRLARQDMVDGLVDFVISERGRVMELEDAYALCLYFATPKDRDDFAALVRQAKPNMIAKPVP